MRVIVYILTFLCLSSFSDIPKNIQKKIDKEIFNIFEIEAYEKELVVIDVALMQQMTKEFDAQGFFKIVNQESHLGYFYLGTAPSKADVIDYIVIFDKDLIIKKIKILGTFVRRQEGNSYCRKPWKDDYNINGELDIIKFGP